MDKAIYQKIVASLVVGGIVALLTYAWSTFVIDVDNLKITVADQHHELLHELNELRSLHGLPSLDTMHEKEHK